MRRKRIIGLTGFVALQSGRRCVIVPISVPCGRTPLTESGLAAFPHPALCETNRSHLSIIYTDIYSGSYQWIAVIYHIQKFYPVVAFLLTPPI